MLVKLHIKVVFRRGRNEEPFLLLIVKREPADVQDAFPVISEHTWAVVVGFQVVKADLSVAGSYQQLLPSALHGSGLALARQHHSRLHRVASFLQTHQMAERVNVDFLMLCLVDGDEAVTGVVVGCGAGQLFEAVDGVFEVEVALLVDLTLEPLICELAGQRDFYLGRRVFVPG